MGGEGLKRNHLSSVVIGVFISCPVTGWQRVTRRGQVEDCQ